MRNFKHNEVLVGSGCSSVFLLMLFNLLIGGWSVDIILSWFGESIPFLGDALIGMFVGEFSVPIAIIGSILKIFGVF